MKILKFYASWCAPCHVLSDILEKEDIEVSGIDIDKNQSLAERYNIMALPTLIKCDETGAEVSRMVGVKSLKDIKEFVK